MMRRRLTNLAPALAALALAGLALLPGHAAQVSLVLEASVAQETFLVGEPVMIELSLTNVGEESAYILDDLEVATETVRIEVQDPSGSVTLYAPRDRRDPSGRIMLEPGRSLSNLTDLRLLRKRWPEAELLFPAPGRYLVTVSYEALLRERASGPPPATVSVEIRDASAEAGADVFRDPLVGRFIAGETGDPAAVRKLEGLAASSGEGPFQRYARFYLGHHCLASSVQAAPGAPGSELDECAGLLRQVDREGFPLRGLALVDLAELELRRGDPDAARKLAERAAQSSAWRSVRERASALIRTADTAPRPRGGRSEAGGAAEALDAGERAAVEAVHAAFLSALERGDVAGSLTWLSEDFVYEGSMSKSRFAGMLEGDLRESAGAAGESGLHASTLAVASGPEGVPILDFELGVTRNGTPLPETVRVIRLGFRKENGNWRIASWRLQD